MQARVPVAAGSWDVRRAGKGRRDGGNEVSGAEVPLQVHLKLADKAEYLLHLQWPRRVVCTPFHIGHGCTQESGSVRCAKHSCRFFCQSCTDPAPAKGYRRVGFSRRVKRRYSRTTCKSVCAAAAGLPASPVSHDTCVDRQPEVGRL